MKNKADSFKERATKLTDKLKEQIHAMPYKGDSAVDSQQVLLLDKLSELEKSISGVRDNDFITKEQF